MLQGGHARRGSKTGGRAGTPPYYPGVFPPARQDPVAPGKISRGTSQPLRMQEKTRSPVSKKPFISTSNRKSVRFTAPEQATELGPAQKGGPVKPNEEMVEEKQGRLYFS